MTNHMTKMVTGLLPDGTLIRACEVTFEYFKKQEERIKQLEAVTKDDAKWLAAYHKWCEMNGCAPSSSDLISARKALEDSQ